MRPQAWDSVAFDLAIAGVCAAIGLVGLPLAFGGAPASESTTLVWLLAAVAFSILVLIFLPRVSRPLAVEIGRGVGGSAATPSQSLLLARLLTVGVALLTCQAMLRRPIALALGGSSASTSVEVEAGIAAAALTAVLALLVWSYQTARPMVQAVTLRALDAAIPTVNAPPVSEPTRTLSIMTSQPVPSPTDAPTLRAAPRVDEPTVRTRAPVDEPPVRMAAPVDEPTLRATAPVDEPTLRASAVDEVDEPTLRSDRIDPNLTQQVDRAQGPIPRDDDQTLRREPPRAE